MSQPKSMYDDSSWNESGDGPSGGDGDQPLHEGLDVPLQQEDTGYRTAELA